MTARCARSAGGAVWVYLRDDSTAVTGRSSSNFVSWSGALATC